MKERDTNNIIDPLFRQSFEIYRYFSIFRDQECVDIISRLHTKIMFLDLCIGLIKKTSREGELRRTTHGILESDIRISMSPVESISNSSHKAGSSETACFSVLATVQQKYL